MSGERGEISLTALLVSSIVMLAVLGATLTLFDGFQVAAAQTAKRTDAQDVARTANDRIAKALRNLASPTPDQPQGVDKAGPQDLVFKTVDGSTAVSGLNATNIKRVRYCLGAGGVLHEQTQTWATATAPAIPSTVSCPGAGWSASAVAATKIVNDARPIFIFNAAALTAIAEVHVDLRVDDDVTKLPIETQLSSGVFLRNQNRKPTASFTAVKVSGGLVLNGSASVDPEGEPLSYVWYDGATKIGTGITFNYAVPAGTSHTIALQVFDPAALQGDAPAQTVIA